MFYYLGSDWDPYFRPTHKWYSVAGQILNIDPKPQYLRGPELFIDSMVPLIVLTKWKFTVIPPDQTYLYNFD